MKNNSYSPLALYALQQFAGLEKSAGKVELLFNSLSAANKNYPSAAEFREKMEIAKRTGIGKIAMDFTQNNTLDSPVLLSSLNGRYLTIDFWPVSAASAELRTPTW